MMGEEEMEHGGGEGRKGKVEVRWRSGVMLVEGKRRRDQGET